MRDLALDVIRGALMFYIIAVIHGVFWLDLIPRPYSTILLFEMPCIFLVSGYAFGLYTDSSKYMSGWISYRKYCGARLTRIFVPYFAYAVICAFLVMSLNKSFSFNLLLAWLNPVSDKESVGVLTWHLWFITPFAMVTLTLPFFFLLNERFSRTKLLLVVGSVAVLTLEVTLPGFIKPSLIKTYIFYLFWSVAGYWLQENGIPSKKYLWGLFALSTLMLTLLILVGGRNVDMQQNKFPPNILFFLFSASWLFLLLILNKLISSKCVNWLGSSFIFKPFIHSGYSIYLWQGLGYTIALWLGKYTGQHPLITLVLAIVVTYFLGIVFSPLEKIRFKSS